MRIPGRTASSILTSLLVALALTCAVGLAACGQSSQKDASTVAEREEAEASAPSPDKDGAGAAESGKADSKKDSDSSKTQKQDSASDTESAQNEETDKSDAGGSKAADGKASKPSSSNSGKKNSSSSSQSSKGEKAPQSDKITVTVSIDASRAGDAYSSVSCAARKITLDKKATAFDALVSLGVAIGGDSTYVSSISGLAEKQSGPLSGWMYSVDGEFPQVSCGKYQMKDGQVLVWAYTCDLGRDL